MENQDSIKHPSTISKPIVFYDGGCSLCRREINHYQTMKGADSLNWVNIDQQNDLLERFDITHKQAMERLHVIDSDGNKQTGAYAFVVIWRHISALKWLSLSLEKLRVVGLVDRLYTVFARWRFKRRAGQSSCEINTQN